jgi:hypothetical protein
MSKRPVLVKGPVSAGPGDGVAGEGVDEAAGKEAVGAGTLEHADRITAMATIRDEIRRPLI